MKAMEGREVAAGRVPGRRRRAARARGGAGAGALGPAARGGAARARAARASTRTSPTACARSRPATTSRSARRRGSRSTRARASSRRGRRTTTSPTRATTRAPSRRAARSIVIGAGPNRIGQAIEFDYCCVHAVQALQKLGYEAVHGQLEPRDGVDRLRHLRPPLPRAARRRRTCSTCASSSSRSASPSRSAGRRRCGWRRRSPRRACRCSATRSTRSTPPRTAAASRRSRATWRRSGGRPRTPTRRARSRSGSATRCSCGRTTCSAGAACTSRTRPTSCASTGPCLVDRYLEGALELDVDALCDGEDAWVAAVLEHVEPAGVHSGDSACVLPGPSVTRALEDEIRDGREADRRAALGARGLLNLQLAVHGGRLYVLEANPRASRTVPFVAKATGVPLVEHSVRLLLGEPLGALDLPERAVPTRAWAKEAVFPSERFPGAATRGPEMRSTGEVMAGAATAVEAYRARDPRRRPRAARRGDSARHCRPQRYPEPACRRSSTRSTRPKRRASRRRSATVVATLRSAPRQPGAKMVDHRGRPHRRLRLGRVRRGRRRRARQAGLRAASPRARSTTASPTRDAFEVGLSCGGEIDVWLEKADVELWRDVRALLDADELRDALHRHRRPARSGSSAACSRAPASATTASSPR